MREMELIKSRHSRIFHPPTNRPPILPTTNFTTIASNKTHKRTSTEINSLKLDYYQNGTIDLDNFYRLKNGHDYYMKRLGKVSCRKLEKIFKPVITQEQPYMFPSVSFHSSTLSANKNNGSNAPFAFTRLHQRSISEYKTSNINSERVIHQRSKPKIEMSSQLQHLLFDVNNSVKLSPENKKEIQN